jgi:hypothetical protein
VNLSEKTDHLSAFFSHHARPSRLAAVAVTQRRSCRENFRRQHEKQRYETQTTGKQPVAMTYETLDKTDIYAVYYPLRCRHGNELATGCKITAHE